MRRKDIKESVKREVSQMRLKVKRETAARQESEFIFINDQRAERELLKKEE